MVIMKEFAIGEVFEINSSKLAIHKNMISNFDGPYPYVTRTSANNGVDSYIQYDESFLNPGNTISLAMDTYIPFYQFKSYFTGNKVKVLSNGNLNRKNAQYLITALIKTFQLYEWGTGMDVEKLSGLTLSLPVQSISDTEPDWAYMEQYMKDIEKKTILRVKEENDREIARLKELVGENAGEELEEVAFGEFPITDIFESISRGTRLIKTDRTPGNVPLVTAGKLNYGIAEHIKKHEELFTGDNLTIDMFGNVFYRGYDYFSDDNIISLKSPHMNMYHYIYISSALSYLTQMYGYGSQFRLKSIEETTVILPISPTQGSGPNWQYMERYIKKMKHEYIKRKEVENDKQVQLMLDVTGIKL